MYERILRAPLEFKPAACFSQTARELIDGMLQKEPDLRLGSGPADGDDIRKHAWFAPIDWTKLEARQLTPPFKPNVKTHFCTMLDGEGGEVFDVLRSSFALARERCGHVVMTATITCNQKKWKKAAVAEEEVRIDVAPSPSAAAAEEPPFYESIEAVLGELDMW